MHINDDYVDDVISDGDVLLLLISFESWLNIFFQYLDNCCLSLDLFKYRRLFVLKNEKKSYSCLQSKCDWKVGGLQIVTIKQCRLDVTNTQ